MIASVGTAVHPPKLRIEPAVMEKLSGLKKPVEEISLIADVLTLNNKNEAMRAISLQDAVLEMMQKGTKRIIRLFERKPLVNGEIRNGLQVVVNPSGEIENANIFMQKVSAKGKKEQAFPLENVTPGSARGVVNEVAKKVFPDERLFKFL